MKKIYRTKWVNCEFCRHIFKTNTGKIDDGRGKFCCRQCMHKGRLLHPFSSAVIKRLMAERASIRRVVKERGLDVRP